MMLLRSVLFVPAHDRRKVEKARNLAVDAICLDLEDAVPPDHKKSARAAVRQIDSDVGPAVMVRVNAVASGLLVDDLEAVVMNPWIWAVMLPNVESAADVAHTVELLAGMETGPRMRIIPLIESPLGVLKAHDIASASEQIETLTFGAVDFAAEMGVRWSVHGAERATARSLIALACAAARLPGPVDSVFIDLDDEEGFVSEARSARDLGYQGKLLIHPRQVEPCHRCFMPRPEDVDYARRVLSAFEAAEREGKAALRVDSSMVDYAVVRWAERVCEQAEAAGTW